MELLTKLGVVEDRRGKYVAAETRRPRVVDIRADVLAEKHLNTLRSLSSLGCTLSWQEIFATGQNFTPETCGSEEGKTEQRIPWKSGKCDLFDYIISQPLRL